MLFKIQNLSYTTDKRAILSHRSLNIENGQNTLLLGPSGCGKTTLLNLLAGLLKPSVGEILFEDQVYSGLSGTELDRLRAQYFGFVFQKIHLIGHLSIAQNIAIVPLNPEVQRVQELINDLGLAGKEHQKARDLSVGEAQRVAIARALANNPKVIFADEPTSALDDANTEKVMDMIFTQAEKTGATVIAATHDARIKNRFKTVMEMTQ
jgi:putative ABC transport system ATP-binding protein